MNGRLILAGHDPSKVTLRDALDASVALLVEAYRSYGMDYFEAIKQAVSVGIPDAEKPKEPEAEIDNDASMNALMGALAGTGKKFA